MKQATTVPTQKTRIDLNEELRRGMVGLLNEQLADSITLSMQAKQAHWNVRGRRFLQLHELFDKLYEEATEWTDELAERAAQLGGIAEGTVEAVSQRTRLPAYDLELQSGDGHLEALRERLASFARTARAAIDEASRAGDQATADIFTEITREADKTLWFLEAHLQGGDRR